MTSLPPFDPDNPDPEVWQFCNEVYQTPPSLGRFNRVLTKMRNRNRVVYVNFVRLFRATQ